MRVRVRVGVREMDEWQGVRCEDSEECRVRVEGEGEWKGRMVWGEGERMSVWGEK